ncbi:casein kinase II subunit alpha-4, chloroplastic-like [Cynara cardunculus var. scolymus]|uniref:casein kinase II subunit alpha-4, chloroplastic-like n=1 Tax=Cynara cardunculus var. scolymus TaxID=59895 RepID=UPI000D62ADC0|nr:casein kinase II subunit alpha-4, chloroplastic-like [Cynara cardunculus var. scolymus]
MAARPSLHFIASSINITKSSLSPSSTLLLRRIASATAPPQQHHHRKQKHKHIYPPQNPLPHPPTPSFNSLRPTLSLQETLAQKIGKAIRRPGAPSKARVYTDVNVIRPKEYWDYESLIYGGNRTIMRW